MFKYLFTKEGAHFDSNDTTKRPVKSPLNIAPYAVPYSYEPSNILREA
jgi:hypothetical protein